MLMLLVLLMVLAVVLAMCLASRGMHPSQFRRHRLFGTRHRDAFVPNVMSGVVSTYESSDQFDSAYRFGMLLDGVHDSSVLARPISCQFSNQISSVAADWRHSERA